MANKTFETRIQLKYDSYANWTANNPTPLSGEVCVVVIPAETGAVVQEPSVLFKVGDGTTAFNALPYVSAIAADVYDWAKAAAKPEYTAAEIAGLADYISGKVQDTNTQYKLEQDATDAHILKLSKKDISDADYSVIATITTADTVYDDTALAGRVTALEGLVGSTAVATQIANAITALDLANTYDTKGSAAAVQSDLDAYKTSNDAAVAEAKKAGTDASDALNAYKTTNDAAVAAAKKAGDDAAAALETYKTSNDAAVKAAQDASDAAQADVDALAGKVGEVPADKTVVQMIEEAQTSATYDDTEVRGLIQDNADAIGVLNGDETTAGSVKKTVSDEIAKVIAGAPESFDTLKEVSDWIATHGQDAAAMNSAILALQAIVDGIGDTENGEKATVVAYVTDAIAALNIGDYAKAAELTALADRVTAAEGKITALETEVAKKANDADLAAVAKSGKIEDIAQDSYIILNCGSSSTVI